jgi:DNA replication initiation complex subunit (GINS family)
MNWEAYQKAISEAKEEFYQEINPFVVALQEARDKAWERYLRRIIQADNILSGGEGTVHNKRA